MNEAGNRVGKGWDPVFGERVIKYVCGETGFRKEQSSVMGAGRKGG